MNKLLSKSLLGLYSIAYDIADLIQFIKKKLFYILYDEDTLCEYGFHKQDNIVLETMDSLDGERMYVRIACKKCNSTIQSFTAYPYIIKRRYVK